MGQPAGSAVVQAQERSFQIRFNDFFFTGAVDGPASTLGLGLSRYETGELLKDQLALHS